MSADGLFSGRGSSSGIRRRRISRGLDEGRKCMKRRRIGCTETHSERFNVYILHHESKYLTSYHIASFITSCTSKYAS